MSHVTDMSCKIRDLVTAQEVLVERFPALEFREGRRHHAWWGRFMQDSTPSPGRDPKDYGKCEHTIGRKGRKPTDGPGGEYEIGLVPALDGDGFDLLCDTYTASGRALANDLPRFKQEYAAKVAEKRATEKLTRKGFRTTRETLTDGTIRLRLRRRR